MNLIKKKDASEITRLLESNAYSVHEMATVLKNLLAEMPEPLLIESYYPFHCSLASIILKIIYLQKKFTSLFKYFISIELNHPERQIRGCQLLVLLLPAENAAILRRLLCLLHEVSLHETSNKMNAMNLGIVLAPHILCPRKV